MTTETTDRAFVFLDDNSRPYLAFRGCLHYWHQNDNWVTLRPLRDGEREDLELRKLPQHHAAMYGWPCDEAAEQST